MSKFRPLSSGLKLIFLILWQLLIGSKVLAQSVAPPIQNYAVMDAVSPASGLTAQARINSIAALPGGGMLYALTSFTNSALPQAPLLQNSLGQLKALPPIIGTGSSVIVSDRTFFVDPNFIFTLDSSGGEQIESIHYANATGNLLYTGSVPGGLPGIGAGMPFLANINILSGFAGAVFGAPIVTNNSLTKGFVVSRGLFPGSNWYSEYDCFGSGYFRPIKIISDNSGNVYVGGFWSGTCDLDPIVNPGVSVVNAGLTIQAGSIIYTEHGIVIKYSSSGTLQGYITIPANLDAHVEDLAIDNNQNILYVSGSVNNDTLFSPSIPGIYYPTGISNTLSTFGGRDIFIASYSISNIGAPVPKTFDIFGGLNGDASTSISVDTNGSVYISGLVTPGVFLGFDLTGTSVVLNSTVLSSSGNSNQGIIAKYTVDQVNPSATSLRYNWSTLIGENARKLVYKSSTNEILVAGQADDGLGAYSTDPWVASIDASTGTINWFAQYLIFGYDEEVSSICLDSNGNLIMALGFSLSGGGQPNNTNALLVSY